MLGCSIVLGYSARVERFFANFLHSGVCSGLEIDLLAILIQHKLCDIKRQYFEYVQEV